MTSALYDSIARIARHEAGTRAIAGAGVVTDVFAADGASPDYAATVTMRDTGVVLPRVPIAAGVLGFAAIPAIGDLVVVVCLEGDLHAPVIVGRLYHPDQNPPKHGEGQVVLALPSGDSDPKLRLEVEGAKPSISLKLPGGEMEINLDEKNVHVKIGEIELTMTSSGGGRAEIAAGDSKIILKQSGDISVEASGKMQFKATAIELSGSAKVKISGAQVEVN